MVKLLFMRHGEAEHNLAFHEGNDEIFKSMKDPALTEQGKLHARQAASQVPASVTQIWSSPSLRCVQTMFELFHSHPDLTSDLYCHDSLLEYQCPQNICNRRQSRQKLREQFPEADLSFLADEPAVYSRTETIYALHQRILSFVLWLHATNDPTETILIVSHKDVLRDLLGKGLGNCEIVSRDSSSFLKQTD